MSSVWRRGSFWIAFIMILLGVGVLAFASYYTVATRKKLNRYVEISAVVIDYKETISETDDSYHILYAEIVQYQVDGVTYTATNSASSNSPKRKGSTLKIAYNPDDPADCIFVSSSNILVIVLFVLGAGFSAIGILFAVRLVKTLRWNSRGLS